MQDGRKINILKVDLQRFDIAPDVNVSVKDCLLEILDLLEHEAGIVYLELSNYSTSFPAKMIVEAIEAYHFLSKLEKMSRRKSSIIENILNENDIDGNAEFSYSDILENFIENSIKSKRSLNELMKSPFSSIDSEQSMREAQKEEAKLLYWKGVQQEGSAEDILKYQKGRPFFEEAAKKGNEQAEFRLRFYSYIDELPSIIRREDDEKRREKRRREAENNRKRQSWKEEIERAKAVARAEIILKYPTMPQIYRKKLERQAERNAEKLTILKNELSLELEYPLEVDYYDFVDFMDMDYQDFYDACKSIANIDCEYSHIMRWLREHDGSQSYNNNHNSEALFLLVILIKYNMFRLNLNYTRAC